MLASCKADMICPAYQSYFLLDETAQRDQFSYFAEDSLPRRDVFYSTLDKNGLVAKTSLFAYVDADWVKNRQLRTVKMEVIYPVLSDSLLFSGDAMMYAETDVVDSTALDSARMAAQTFRYGADQKYYNWYFRDKLVWKDELEGAKEETDNASEVKEEKGGFFSFFSFFKNLFKKKDKVSIDSSEAIDTASQQDEDGLEEGPSEKNGMFKKKDKQPKQPKEKKVKSKKEKKPDPAPSKPPSPSEPEDDGEDDFRL